MRREQPVGACRLLVLGNRGQLASAIARAYPCLALGSSELDITDKDAVSSEIARIAPEVVVNAAAFTAVDCAESEVELAMAVNRDGAAFIAEACARGGIRLVHVSTDFVFDGKASAPIPPNADGHPVSVYGQSKWEGELAVRDVLGEAALVVRTAWVYASGHANFVATMLRLMRERDELGVVADQIGTPTWSRTLADGLVRLIEAGATGVHHLTDAGIASWYDFAVAIESIGRARGLLASRCRIRPIRTVDYPTPATRPMYGVLDKTSTFELLGGPTPHWRDSLESCLADWRDPS